MNKAKGFTLIELMVVVLVVAVLAGLAFSSYEKQLLKSRRAEAKQILADYALREEKWRSNNAAYTSTLSDINGVSPVISGNYTIAVTFPSTGNCAGGVAKGSANSFIITAATVPGKVQEKDTSCATLVFTNDCGTTTKSSTPAGNECW